MVFRPYGRRARFDYYPITNAVAELLERHITPREEVIEAAEELLLTLDDGDDTIPAQSKLQTALRDLDNFKRTQEA